jgi:hypothetical protein
MSTTYYFIRGETPGGTGTSEDPIRIAEGTEGDDMRAVYEAGIEAIHDAMGSPSEPVFVLLGEEPDPPDARVFGSSNHDPIVGDEVAVTYDPDELFCFVGTDCEFAGADPLDGEDDRPLVVVPMFLNPCELARNENREAIRAADVIMPSAMTIRFKRDDFVVDENHPLTEALPDSFFEALYNGGNPILLEYAEGDKLTGATSRNPYHARYSRTSDQWVFNATSCVKHFWKAQLTYDNGGAEQTVDVVLQAEHTASDEPQLTGHSQPAQSQINTISSHASSPAFVGTFLIIIDGEESDPIPYNCDAGQLQAALNAMDNVLTGGVTVTHSGGSNPRLSDPGVVMTLTWGGPMVNRLIEVEIDTSELVLNPHTLATTQQGGLPEAGGKTAVDRGLNGTLFALYVFSDQISPEFEDDDTYTPAGGSSAVAFSRHDPLVWGNAPGVSGGNNDDIFAHPQLMAAAVLATTFHSPCGGEFVPIEERERLPDGERGLNLEAAYVRPNCTPWITDPERDYVTLCNGCSGGSGIRNNVVFTPDNSGSGEPWGGMTLGGGLPTSRPTERLCWENGLGTGRTFLKPLTPGWDQEVGELSEVDESSATLSMCVDWDGSWDEYEFETCDGHPAQLFNGVGGTHYCFKTNRSHLPTQCCITLTDASATWTDKCVRDETVFGARVGSLCNVVDYRCFIETTYVTTAAMWLYDYSFAPDTNPVDLRQVQWKYFQQDPEFNLYSYTYDSGDVGDMSQLVGAWTLGATITTTPAGTETLTSILQYDPTRTGSGSWEDATCSALFMNATNITHGIGMRMEDDAGNDAFGYGAYIEPTGEGVGNAVVAKYDNGVETILASQEIVLDNDEVDVVLRVWGHSILFEYEVSGQDVGSISVSDCEITSTGGPTLFTKGTGAVAEFSDWVIQDQKRSFLNHTGSIGSDNIGITTEPKLLDSYGKCNESSTGCCGGCCTPECCNCTSWYQTLWGRSSSSWSGPGDLQNGDDGGSITNPTSCGGPFYNRSCAQSGWCGADELSSFCGSCPEPWACVDFCLPSRCYDSRDGSVTFHYDPEDEPNICSGLTQWCSGPVYCA